MEVIQVPSSKIGGGGDDLQTAAWNGLNRHNGHFDKVQKNDERTFRDEGSVNKEKLLKSVHKTIYSKCKKIYIGSAGTLYVHNPKSQASAGACDRLRSPMR